MDDTREKCVDHYIDSHDNTPSSECDYGDLYGSQRRIPPTALLELSGEESINQSEVSSPANPEAICRIRIEESSLKDDEVSTTEYRPLTSPSHHPDPPLQMRLEWAKEIAMMFLNYPDPHDAIRSWDLVVSLDGSVRSLAAQPSPIQRCEEYPARYRIPSYCLDRLGTEERIKRAELFALGGLLYEIVSLRKPFEELGNGDIQSHYRMGEFPSDVFALPLAETILCCWSPEFDREMEKEKTGFINYVKKHPVAFTFQAVGAVATVASLITVPVLGAVGFAAAGPVAGSAAAAWQASIGLVRAGSFFAWCQSAAMGGSALSGVFAVGAAGAASALGGGIAGAATSPKSSELERGSGMLFREA